MAKQTVPPLPLPKGWPCRVRSAAVHAITLARLAPVIARYTAGTTFAGALTSTCCNNGPLTAHLGHYTGGLSR